MCKVKLPIPSYEEQLEIVNNYKAISERIRLKQKINDNLESQVAALYSEMIRGKEPNAILSDISSICSGKRPTNTKEGNHPLVGAGGIMGYIDVYNFNEPILVTGRVGTHGVIQRFDEMCWASDNTLVIKSQHYEFVYQFLKTVDYSLLNRGSTQPLITQTDLNNLPIFVPSCDELERFKAKAKVIMYTHSLNRREIDRLRALSLTLVDSLSMNNSSR